MSANDGASLLLYPNFSINPSVRWNRSGDSGINLPGIVRMTITNSTNFSHISVKPLHPTFTAEVSGVDFSSPIPDDVFSEVLAALTKVNVPFHTRPIYNLTTLSVWRSILPEDRSHGRIPHRILQTTRRTRRCNAIHKSRSTK